MISCLDSRYSQQLNLLKPFLGDEAFVYYMSVWSITFAELTNEKTFIPLYEDREVLYDRVKIAESETKHQMTALLKVLKNDYPNTKFHFGITSEDIMANSRCLQQNLIIQQIYELIGKLDRAISEISSGINFPILGHTHGQSATPINVESYLRAKCRDIYLNKCDYRLGGSNGQLSILKHIYPKENFNNFANTWKNRTAKKINNTFVFDDTEIIVPNDKIGLLQVGPHNDACYLSAMSMSLKLRALARAFWDHASRGILNVGTTSTQTGSSAMPTKINPILFENAEGCFTISYQTMTTALEANCDSRGLRDLSNSVVNRQVLDGWAFLYLGLNNLIKGIEQASYDSLACIKELEDNPECLGEYLRYYLMMNGYEDPYFEIKNNPPKNFKETLKRMHGWEFKWPKN